MASIRVLHGKDREVTYPDAKNWVIDPSGRLHVTGESGNLASFNSELWQSVELVQTAPRS